ncbi:uncharacterized protein N7518_002480 [Penicillium psychrosexuale]|uniref:uncharacterized protein n=1 Tax=Penicillium psychrosexuale TaxID=1002107 RepID=UPI0025450074|nr:uncharacterized protein N7518_002480 [Penicillium psychrosexuale]KAJ5800412.1 hypothetical protein N7518_002480 [Penicillium psychrosexuale]
MAMMGTKSPGLTQVGMYRCLAYMAMIRDPKKRAGASDTSVYGIATDSNAWWFIHLRDDGKV